MIKLYGAELVRSKVEINVLIFLVDEANGEDLSRWVATDKDQLCGFERYWGERRLAELHLEDNFEVVIDIKAI